VQLTKTTIIIIMVKFQFGVRRFIVLTRERCILAHTRGGSQSHVDTCGQGGGCGQKVDFLVDFINI